MKTIAGMVAREIGVLMEEHKFYIVVEGHQLLDDKIERVDERVEQVAVRVETIDLNLTAHRNDTEAHRGAIGSENRVESTGGRDSLQKVGNLGSPNSLVSQKFQIDG